MKVMILSSYAPTLFYFREDMMKAMINNGHEVIAAAPEPVEEWGHKFKERNIKYVSIQGIERTGTNPIKDINGFFSILKQIKKEKPDKVFAYQAKTIIYGCIAAKLVGVKGIFALMGGLGSVFRNNDRRSIARAILKTEYKFAFNLCDNVFFQNKDDCNEMKNTGLIQNEKIVMINGSGVNLEKFKDKPITQFPVFLFVGRIIRDKGIIEYLEAAKIVKNKYSEARIQIVGYFDTNPTAIKKEEISEYINQGIIEYLGPTDDVRPFLEKSTVYVLPSYHEGTPKSVLEAMAIGRPIITTDAPGCRETVVDGINGFLVPVKNANKLAEKMIWMIEHREDAEIMGQESLRICKEKFDVNKVNEVILKTMNLLLKGKV
ncbi:glycosyltransferase family 4 protein [Peribacillus sp. SIMBA_075]|uniref:glycosyltransferase family 4 protein n=1 Tax=Peribacillus sp. SIMBA_075 TaxID=3085813 RepID=UPI00397927F8